MLQELIEIIKVIDQTLLFVSAGLGPITEVILLLTALWVVLLRRGIYSSVREWDYVILLLCAVASPITVVAILVIGDIFVKDKEGA